jgi:uncharacterized protein
MTRPDFLPGCPCWAELLTPDLDASCGFYGAVLGWSFAPVPGSRHRLAQVDAGPVAAFGPADRDGLGRGGWGLYLACPDLDACCEAVGEAGGEVLRAPVDARDLGRLAWIRDPGGAPVGLWQAGALPGFAAMGSPGAPAWCEVNTRHGPQVRDFFAALFGLSSQQVPGMDYWTLHAGGESAPARFGVLQMNERWAGMEPAWMAYFGVADADAAAARVQGGGGRVAYGPLDTDFGRIAVCLDPHAAAFTLMQPRPGPAAP